MTPKAAWSKDSIKQLRAAPEWRAMLIAFLFFFCLLASFYLLRPVREEMGVRTGLKNLPWLFSGTFVVMLIATPLFGWASSNWRRPQLLKGVYLFFIANLLLFYALMQMGVKAPAVAAAFFIWVSVYNLFVVSVFWSLMTDIFSEAQGKRTFGYIAAGGSLGALAGPFFTVKFVGVIGVPALLLVAAALLCVPLASIFYLQDWAAKHRASGESLNAPQALAGSALEGIRLAFSTPLLRGLCAYFILFTTLSTFLYFEQIRIVGESFASSQVRTAFFAKMDFATNTLTVLAQFFLTRALLQRFGLLRVLLVLPALTLVGFAALLAAPTLAVFAVFNVLRRAADYAFARPAREALFTLVTPTERYKAKNFIDTTVYRGGDAAAAWLDSLIRALGANALVAGVAIPVAGAWLWLVAWLGRHMPTTTTSNTAADLSAPAPSTPR